jgi:hypothetical protein
LNGRVNVSELLINTVMAEQLKVLFDPSGVYGCNQKVSGQDSTLVS